MDITITLPVIIALTAAIVEALKRTRGLSGYLKGRYELTAILLALIISYISGHGLLEGIIAGLSSQGLYDTARAGVNSIK